MKDMYICAGSHDISDSLQLAVYFINNRYTHAHTYTLANLEISTENCGLCNIIRSTGENIICSYENRHHYVDPCKPTFSILRQKSCKSVKSIFLYPYCCHLTYKSPSLMISAILPPPLQLHLFFFPS